MRMTPRSWSRAVVALALVALPVAAAPAAHAGQGTGNPILTVNPPAANPSGSTTVTVTGRDYLVPPYAEGGTVFGGVYLFFGYVEGQNWGPSYRTSTGTQGTFGSTYFYPGSGGDASTRSGAGSSTALVSFSQGGESGTQTPYFMDRNGNWTAQLTVPGPTFTSTLPSGQSRSFDCRTQVCGVFTIGAHGKTSQTNERFAPISFSGGGVGTVGQPYQQPYQQPYAQPYQQPYQQPYAQPYQQPYGAPVGGYAVPPAGGIGAPPVGGYAPPPPQAYQQPYAQQQRQAAPPAAAPVRTATPSATPTTVPQTPLDSTKDDSTVAAAGGQTPAKPAAPSSRSSRAVGTLAASDTTVADDGSMGTTLMLAAAVAAGAGGGLVLVKLLAGGALVAARVAGGGPASRQ